MNREATFKATGISRAIVKDIQESTLREKSKYIISAVRKRLTPIGTR
jgi:hypothetical protein